MNETHDPDDEFYKGVQKTLEQTQKAIDEREIPVYDGVVGEPPDWVPEWAVLYFEGYRDRLRFVRKYEDSELLKWIDQFRKEYLDSIVAPDFNCPETYPNGQNVDPYCFEDEIGFLARLKWCVDQGKEIGLIELSGKNGLLGFQRRKEMSEFGAIHGEQVHNERVSEWDKWIKEKNNLIKINPHLAKNKSELARKIKENLNLDDSVNTIRQRI